MSRVRPWAAALVLALMLAVTAQTDDPPKGGPPAAGPKGAGDAKPPVAKPDGAKADAGPVAPIQPRDGVGRSMRLALQDVALLALRNNPDIQRAGLDATAARGDVRRAKSDFDPVLFANLTHSHQESSGGGGSDPLGGLGALLGGGGDDLSTTDTTVFDVGFRKKLRTGGTVRLTYRTQRTETLQAGGGGLFSFFSVMEPSWTNTIELRLDQPLLQGAGVEFNTANVKLAELGEKIAALNARDTIRRVIGQALSAYWDLALVLRERDVQVTSLKRTERLLELTRERLKRGLISRLEVLRAEVGVASRREGIIRVEQQILDVEDQLKKLILPQTEVFHRPVTLLPTEAPTYASRTLHLPDLIKNGLSFRPDYMRANKEFESRYVAYRRSRNLLLPRLNFAGRVGYLGQGTTYDTADRGVWALDLLNWEASLALEVPLGNRAAKGEVQKAKAQLRQAKIALDSIEKQVVLEVRQAAREVASTLRRIETARESRRLSQEQLDKEVERLRAGQSTNKVVLDYENDLAQQQLKELRAIIEYRKALIKLLQAQGLLLENFKGRQAPPAK